MKKSILLLCLTVLSNISFCQTKKEVFQKLNNYINEVVAINEIPGLSVAVIKNGKVLFEEYYGKASIETNTVVFNNKINFCGCCFSAY